MALELRLIRQGDWDGFLNLIRHNRERLMTYFPQTVTTVINEESAKKYVNNKLQNAANKTGFFHVVVDAENQKMIACVHVKDIDWSVPQAEMSYFIDGQMEGKGVVSRFLKEVIRLCFQEVGLEKPVLRINPENPASRSIALKCGFRKEGYLRSDFRSGDGVLRDSEYYGLLKSDFK